jgi:glyoxylase-like metal-dependent hydrolase (beta-lactamase superfamily II)
MTARYHTFNVGKIECTVLLDGASIMGSDRVVRRFVGGTEAEYRQAYADLGLTLEEAELSFNILLARIGDETVLVDTGEGGRPKNGYLQASLRLAGVDPGEITLVVITHSHGDHVLGLVSGENEPMFPNATYVISTIEMAYWRHKIEDEVPEQRPIVAMMEARGLRMIDLDAQIIPGMTAIPLPGHTPGHFGVVLESENELLFHVADLIHSPMQFAHPEWSPLFDADTSISVPTRRRALGRAADEHLLTLFFHLTFPGLGHVRRVDQGFAWNPLATSSESVEP